jgi:hypothetical protein
MNLPEPEVEYLREDRVTFRWSFEDAPRFTLTRAYGARLGQEYEVALTHIYCRFSAEGELLSARAVASGVKKDGTQSQVRSPLPWRWEESHVYDQVKAWRASR